jgi:ribosomal protein L40E
MLKVKNYFSLCHILKPCYAEHPERAETVRAKASSRCGSGSTKMKRFVAAPASAPAQQLWS